MNIVDPLNMQVCSQCRVDKPLTDYYKYDGVTPFRKCKACVLAARPKKPRVTVWESLPQATRDAVKQDLADRRIKLKDIAAKHGLNYPTFCWSVRNGKCV